jgi:serine/threonine-protein phosphatase 2B catalytic subunit
MLLAVLSVCSPEELEESDDDDTRTRVAAEEFVTHERREQMRSKILAVGKMQRVFEILRFVLLLYRDCRTLTITAHSEEAENASELMAAEPPPTGPSTAIDVLKVQGNQIRRNIRSFDDACVKLIHFQLTTYSISFLVGAVSIWRMNAVLRTHLPTQLSSLQ